MQRGNKNCEELNSHINKIHNWETILYISISNVFWFEHVGLRACKYEPFLLGDDVFLVPLN